MSLVELDRTDEAQRVYDELVKTGRKRLEENESSDFFAKFGEQQTRQAQSASAHYVLGLGLLGQGKTDEARKAFTQASQMNLAQPWAAYYATFGK